MNTVVNISIGQPKKVMLNDQPIQTGIFKQPVAGEIAARFYNLEGDGQADLSVHGGRDKATYVYSEDNYAPFAKALGKQQLEPAQFGENLTVQGCLDTDIIIGETFQIGGVVIKVTQPRIPCFKLGMRFNDKTVPKLFWEMGLLGFYVRVEQEGTMKAGDAIMSLERPNHGISVHDLWAYVTERNRDGATHALASLEHIDDGWKKRLYPLTRDGD